MSAKKCGDNLDPGRWPRNWSRNYNRIETMRSIRFDIRLRSRSFAIAVKIFHLVWIDAKLETRFARMQARGRSGDPETIAKLEELEARERGSDDPNAQQLDAVEALAGFTLANDSSIEDFSGADRESGFERISRSRDRDGTNISWGSHASWPHAAIASSGKSRPSSRSIDESFQLDITAHRGVRRIAMRAVARDVTTWRRAVLDSMNVFVLTVKKMRLHKPPIMACH